MYICPSKNPKKSVIYFMKEKEKQNIINKYCLKKNNNRFIFCMI